MIEEKITEKQLQESYEKFKKAQELMGQIDSLIKGLNKTDFLLYSMSVEVAHTLTVNQKLAEIKKEIQNEKS